MDSNGKPNRTYRFGPLERRGLVGGLHPSQVLCLGIAAAAAVVLLRASPNGAGFGVAVATVAAGAALAFAPIAGRTPIAWVPVLAAWVLHPRALPSRAPAARLGSPPDRAAAPRPLGPS